MTVEEAIAKFKRTSVLWESASNTEMVEAVKMSIAALEEIQQYRAIGTVSEFRELKEKATAKKPIPLDKYGECHECPTCGGYAENNCGCAYRFCPTCGTEFDWSEGKE